jgi:tellurite resistance protein TehA-like permease
VRSEAFAMARQGSRIPLSTLGLGALSVVMIAAGAIGLVEPDLVPQLARPAVAWSLIAVGVLMDVYAMLCIVRTFRSETGGM